MTGDATVLGRLSFVVLASALLRMRTEVQQVSAGALSQMIKPLTAVYQQYAGGTVATRIILDLGQQEASQSNE